MQGWVLLSMQGLTFAGRHLGGDVGEQLLEAYGALAPLTL
jgi:hypothetical protein